ncbi:MAG: hypothetical protein AAB601_00775, partial [Patescibacteria group bacterium]
MKEPLSEWNVAVVLVLIALAVSGLFLWYGSELPRGSFPAVSLTNQQAPTPATYVNAKGEKWSVPAGEFVFNVSSNPKLYPRFLSGVIDPLDVKVGETQRMKVVVVDRAQPKSVVAEIEHDAGKDVVPLTLTGTKALAREELEQRPYLVDESGKLILNDASDQLSVKSVVETLVRRAEAEGEAEYTYEGEWVVHDTHTKTYRTTFIAEGSNGERATNVMAWSDPDCEFTPLGVLQNNCAAQAGSVEGFDGTGRAVLNPGVQVVLVGGVGGSRFVFNSGSSI